MMLYKKAKKTGGFRGEKAEKAESLFVCLDTVSLPW